MDYIKQPYPTAQQAGNNDIAYGQKAPPPPTRFSSCAGKLEARVAHLHGLIDRVARVADRLGGSVPTATDNPNKVRGNGGNVAAQIEQSLDDLDILTKHAEVTIERLEAL